MDYFLAGESAERDEHEELALALVRGLDRREMALVIKVISALRLYFSES